MATYSPNFTARYKLRYSARNAQYQMVFRQTGTAPEVDPGLVSQVKAFLDALAPYRATSWTPLQAEYAQQGSDIFLPSTLPVIVPGTNTETGKTEAFQASFLSFSGRSSLGNAMRIFVYGVGVDPLTGTSDASDYRYLATEQAPVANAILGLFVPPGLLAASDGLPVVFPKPYANIGISAYRQRRRRG